MVRTVKTVCTIAVSLTCLSWAGGAQATPAYALAANKSTLVRFDTAAPGTVTTVGALSGAALQLDGIDFRPADGKLYGYSASTSGIYQVDTGSGATTLVSTATAPVGSPLGIDFNPAADRMRVVGAGDENRRINISTGATLSDGTLAYAAGDPNVGVNPNIIDAAYTNNDNLPATATTLYYLDYLLNTLVTTSNPNGGVLNTVGALGFVVDSFLGFDIFTDAGGSNTAFASLRVGGNQGLYTVNLATGAASLVGNLGMDQLNGLAVATVPEPSSAALVALGGLGWLALRRRSGAVSRVHAG